MTNKKIKAAATKYALELIEAKAIQDYQQSWMEAIYFHVATDVLKNTDKQFTMKDIDNNDFFWVRAYAGLRPLEDLWRKENPRPQFTLPDTRTFVKWIVKKIIVPKKDCVHPYASIQRKGDYEKCNSCGKVLCKG